MIHVNRSGFGAIRRQRRALCLNAHNKGALATSHACAVTGITNKSLGAASDPLSVSVLRVATGGGSAAGWGGPSSGVGQDDGRALR